MAEYSVGDHEGWEDNYHATLFATFDEFIADLEGWTFGPFGDLNQPIWMDYDAGNEADFDCGPTVTVGIFLPRHGRCSQKIAPATIAQQQRVCDLLGRFWAGRMDVGFERYHIPAPMAPANA